MKRICKQCGKEFVLTQDEIAFYQSKNLHIPKRCEACRRENRASGKTGEQMQPRQVVRAYHGKENDRKNLWTAVAAVLILLAVVILGFRMGFLPGQDGGAAQEQTVQTVTYTYNFRRAEYLQEHFEKHGAEFGYATAEEYLAGANRVIASADVLHKLEAEDGDDVYYLEATNEFVIVSTDGFLRTYFKPEDGKTYYDRQ